jgi:hypothetical protein
VGGLAAFLDLISLFSEGIKYMLKNLERSEGK